AEKPVSAVTTRMKMSLGFTRVDLPYILHSWWGRRFRLPGFLNPKLIPRRAHAFNDGVPNRAHVLGGQCPLGRPNRNAIRNTLESFRKRRPRILPYVLGALQHSLWHERGQLLQYISHHLQRPRDYR